MVGSALVDRCDESTQVIRRRGSAPNTAAGIARLPARIVYSVAGEHGIAIVELHTPT
ncbi:MAG: hypothetical protein U0821_26490 [Chloroflexota bacterium]